ncbi:hypothetical protein BOTBODRAFT_50383 [Botryobasidium botryosum FD-172 SS1]|uniref:Uncharacterized protein n=1 Tax=Botryobasidium botryosum (strain FD-172 SS1) TaxID=930990 RepID=A0A067NDM5_BOTB1|nr:hypothetical protein BOTBODRAFT_50383 [Botryobasidium botryosum FD-172 SS1]
MERTLLPTRRDRGESANFSAYFRTFKDEGTKSCIWADVSDKEHIIPVKFLEPAVTAYEESVP